MSWRRICPGRKPASLTDAVLAREMHLASTSSSITPARRKPGPGKTLVSRGWHGPIGPVCRDGRRCGAWLTLSGGVLKECPLHQPEAPARPSLALFEVAFVAEFARIREIRPDP